MKNTKLILGAMIAALYTTQLFAATAPVNNASSSLSSSVPATPGVAGTAGYGVKRKATVKIRPKKINVAATGLKPLKGGYHLESDCIGAGGSVVYIDGPGLPGICKFSVAAPFVPAPGVNYCNMAGTAFRSGAGVVGWNQYTPNGSAPYYTETVVNNICTGPASDTGCPASTLTPSGSHAFGAVNDASAVYTWKHH